MLLHDEPSFFKLKLNLNFFAITNAHAQSSISCTHLFFFHTHFFDINTVYVFF